MKCKNCGCENPNQDEASRCKECGTVLGEGGETVVLDARTQVNVDPLSFSPGEIFGQRYQVIEEIGQGGMGRVFKAKDLELDIIVALKMIKPRLSSDPAIETRFKRELLLAREILHEHVIRIHDLGEISGIKYISMNYIQGNSLQEIIQATGKLTVEKAIDITKQVCSALSAAHNKGIIHRDLKPRNIMIDKKGKAYVLDFGIARSIDDDPGSTREGTVVGTPYYMSPEQIKGEKADVAADIYSLGIIMYEILTGKLPFTADNPVALLHKHLNEKPQSPSELNPQVPVQLEKIILKCLEKKKKYRYQSAAEIVKDLEQDKTVQIAPVRGKKRKMKYVLRTILALAAVYAVISISSLVNDSVYKGKIEYLKKEYETYYKNYFPIKKDWLPGDWRVEKCNGWETYVELFPPQSDNEGRPIPQRQYLENKYVKNILANPLAEKFEGIANRLEYKNVEELKNIIAAYGKYFQYDRLFAAVKCSKLDPSAAIKKNRRLYLPMVLRYTDMITSAARVDFLEGDYEAGLTKLYDLMIFTLDLFAASTNLVEDQVALSCFNTICRELIPLLLSHDIDVHAFSPLQLECLQAFGRYREKSFSFPVDAPPVEESPGIPIIESFENLIAAALKKFEPHSIFYKEYLDLIKSYDAIYNSMGMTESDYHLYRKLESWKQWFSINRYFYKEGIEFYRGLFKRIKLIRDMHDKSIAVEEYFKEQVRDDRLIDANVPRSAVLLNTSRTYGKLILIIHLMNRYGPESKEFLNVKGTDLFVNELSGEKFALTAAAKTQANDYSIILDKTFTLALKKFNYRENHKQVLEALKQFDRSLSYSFFPAGGGCP